MSRRPEFQLVDESEGRGTGGRGSTDSAGLPSRARCPFCDGRDTAPLASYGSLLMTSQYHCRRCRSTFERVRSESD